MKKFLMLCLITLLTTNAKSQIKVVHSTYTISKEEIQQYDSTNISRYSGEKYIGQRGIYFDNPVAKMLYTKDYKSFGGEKKYDAPIFTYFDVVGFKPPQEFELKRADNGDICFFTSFGDGTNPLILIPYYEWLKNRLISTYRIIDNEDGIWKIEDIYLKNDGLKYLCAKERDTIKIELNTLYGTLSYLEILKEIESKYLGSEWAVDNENNYATLDTVCVEKGNAFCLFKDIRNRTYRFRIEKTLAPTVLLPKFTKEEALKHIQKFGLKMWKSIINSDVEIGMTSEMVLLSIGNPIDVVRLTETSGSSENWKYLHKNVFFVNNKVNHITEY